MSRSFSHLQRLCGVALLGALAFLVLLMFRVPLFPAASFLSFECKDVILAVAGLVFGPVAGAAAAAVTCLVEWLTISSTGVIGFVMNLLSSLCFLLPAAFLYSKKRTSARALIGLVLGALLMCGVMLLWNIFLTPLYMGVSRQAVMEMLVPVFLPFNLIKGGLNAGITLLLWHLLQPALSKARLLPEGPEPTAGTARWTPVALAGVLLGVSALAVWLLQ